MQLSPGALPAPVPSAPQEEVWQENLQVRLICRDCQEDPPNLVEDHASGDLICGDCGLVLQHHSIDTSSEWRTFSNDDQGNDDPSRVGDGPNALLNGAQLNTSIAFEGGGMRSRELHRAQNKTNVDKGNKILLAAYKQIGALCDGWQLPNSVADSAKHIYKDAEESKQFKGKTQEALIAGCLFLACRRHKVQRTFREVMDLTNVSKKEIGRTFKLLQTLLSKLDKHKDVMLAAEEPSPGDSANPAALCARFCSRLNLDVKTSNVANDIAAAASKIGVLAGRSPLSTAAASIFMAGHLMDTVKTAKEIQVVAGVSDSTIRQAYKLLYNDRDKLLTPEIRARGADEAKLPKPA